MDYPLENLDPERFQLFCQSLLVREQKDIQCFPVGQPDGGRDAVSYDTEARVTGKFLTFQVKFSRRPFAEPDPHKWLLAVMQAELPKISRMIPRGASGFYLITNIPGTAHAEVGSMDLLNDEVAEQIKVPFFCWWRDDICRRLDSAWDVKWMYPELMTGPDFLRAILETGIGEARERREAAIRAFLSEQYKNDEQVRFKQVELQNTLLDLFVDVPIAIRAQSGGHRFHHIFYQIARLYPTAAHDTEENDPFASISEYDPRFYLSLPEVGAAALLLNSATQQEIPRLVLEGAPGQGKSTIAQFVSQVHRMKLLKDDDALSFVRKEHKDNSTRLPIKIDLRDLATWLDKKDPFGVDDEKQPPVGWRKSLESFLAALISAQSGGTSFSTDDLLAVMRISSVLLVFDGLDEVADIALRQEVVDEILKGVQRLEANAASLQVVITSRPAAFANSPGMPPDRYPHLQLISLSRNLIDEYADKWLRARRVDSKESSEFKRVLRDKLDQPHLRDLARNPMQLAILLSLVSTRGTSLPDKRTALYDSYVDLFFNREAEKSAIVREHRDLLIEIHRYLAWVLHSEAERGNSRGSISQDRLQTLLARYLAREEYDPNLARELFTGMVERVVALVSRVEGTFEFEVQPLREYFAARFLYDTAPYSPTGSEQRGTKPDRFDAIARNFYWTNVTRFYAGCYSKGELPGLVERLQELAAEDGFRLTTHPRMLAATLLGDWVFSQNPKSVQAVIKLVLDGLGLRYLIATGSPGKRRRGLWNPLVLPPKCGRDQLVNACFEILGGDAAPSYARDVIELLKANASAQELTEHWIKRFDGRKSHTWLEYGLNLGVLSQVQLEQLEALVPIVEIPLALLYRARRLEILERTEGSFDEAVNAVLDGRLVPQRQKRMESALDSLCLAVDPIRYAVVFSERAPAPLSAVARRVGSPQSLLLPDEIATNTEAFRAHGACTELAGIADRESRRSAAEWASDIGPWQIVVEEGRRIFGDRLAFYALANVAAGIRSTSVRCKEDDQLLDKSRPLCPRARHARLRSSDPGWWKAQFASAKEAQERMFVALMAISWALPKITHTISEELDEVLRGLQGKEWTILMRLLRQISAWTHPRGRKRRLLKVEQLPGTLSPRTVTALGVHGPDEVKHEIYEKFLRRSPSLDPFVLEFIQEEALDPLRFGTPEWSPDLPRVEECYRSGAVDSSPQTWDHQRPEAAMPLEIAAQIASKPNKFPSSLLKLADESWTREVGRRSRPVAQIAEQACWFEAPAMGRLFEE